MSSQLKASFASVIILLSSIFASIGAQAYARLDLNQIKAQEMEILTTLVNPTVSKQYKIQALKANKDLIEENLKLMLLEKEINPNDISNPETDVAKIFQVVDLLTVLSQLEVENGLISVKSCNEALAMFDLSLMVPGSEVARAASPLETKTLQILQSLCK